MIDPEGLDYVQMGEIASQYEGLGFDTVAVFDHFHPIHSAPSTPYPECWSALTYISTITKRVRLASFMTCTSYRNPGLLAKVSSAVDRLSGGRLVFGVGSGWYREEYEAYGFPNYEGRTELFIESLKIVKSLWEDEETDFEGKYFRINKALNFPKPIQKPHPPVMVGSEMGGEKSLRLAVQAADMVNVGWNLPLSDLKAVAKRIAKLCREAGRDPGSLEVSTNLDIIVGSSSEDAERRARELWGSFKGRYPSFADFRSKFNNSLFGTPEHCIQMIKEISDAGFSEIYLQPFDLPWMDTMRLFFEAVLPSV